ncbi:MAG: hypothetical protein NPIRA04_20730 [Nitrospirales bacterium]|nr:MAG: hypothetical protein NPIRA04_20730 [Nitrospirales bacterium]
MATSLGKLQRYNLQDFWGEEFEKFSSWLIQEDILGMIGEGIDLKLIPTKQDKLVSLPQGGVIAKNAKNADIIFIQGQLLELTHNDFGQLISCAAEVNASSIVWVASKIPIEYRSAINWLNTMSRHDVSFYCAELELWRIDNSAPAANFHVVCQPGQMTRKVQDGQDSVVERVAGKQEVPFANNAARSQKKGDWTKATHENLPPLPQGQSPAQVKEEVAVRENFVYTKSF